MIDTIFGRFVGAKALKIAREFDTLSCDVERYQRKVLFDKLKRNASSRFAEDYGIDTVAAVKDFQAVMPVTTYDDYIPYIEKVKKGDTRQLFGPREKVLMFSISSGTTGSKKYIPLTKTFLKEYRYGWFVWGAYIVLQNKDAFQGKILQVVSSNREELTESGIPCGAVSGLIADMQNPVVRSVYAVPKYIKEIHDPVAKYYVIVRFAIAKNISIMCSANPSTFLMLAKILDENKELLVKDIFNGTISETIAMPVAMKKKINKAFKGNPAFARQLEKIIEDTGHLYPQHIWGNLKLIGTWKGGPLQSYLKRFPEYFGSVEIRDIGLMASEARMSIPITSDGSAGLLDIYSNFYEFIPDTQIDVPNPETLLAHQVKKGESYYIVLTTSSGLYRYNIYDHIKVVDFHNQLPVIEFLNKGEHISNITGEKISEYHVVEAMEMTSKTLGTKTTHFVMCPQWNETPCYCVIVPEDEMAGEEIFPRFLKTLDTCLKKVNVEYDSKRSSGRLGHVSLKVVTSQSFHSLDDESEAKTKRFEQYKHKYLVTDEDFCRNFRIIKEFHIS